MLVIADATSEALIGNQGRAFRWHATPESSAKHTIALSGTARAALTTPAVGKARMMAALANAAAAVALKKKRPASARRNRAALQRPGGRAWFIDVTSETSVDGKQSALRRDAEPGPGHRPYRVSGHAAWMRRVHAGDAAQAGVRARFSSSRVAHATARAAAAKSSLRLA